MITFGGNRDGPPGHWLALDASDSVNAKSVAAVGVVGALMRRIRDALIHLRWPFPRASVGLPMGMAQFVLLGDAAESALLRGEENVGMGEDRIF